MIGQGIKAGLAGALVMSISTNLEMRISGREASDAPAKALELVIVPALGAGDPPWKWSRQGTAEAVLHHAVYALATAAALERIRARD